MGHAEPVFSNVVVLLEAVDAVGLEDASRAGGDGGVGGAEGEVIHAGGEARHAPRLLRLRTLHVSLHPHGCLPLLQEVLLGADDGAWSAEPDPGDGLCCCKAVVLHQVTAYESACTPKASFAVDGHGSVGALADVQEAAGDDVAWRAAVYEEQVVVVEAGIREALGIVDLLVEPDDRGNVVLSEVREVCFWSVKRVTIFYFTFGMGSTEG